MRHCKVKCHSSTGRVILATGSHPERGSKRCRKRKGPSSLVEMKRGSLSRWDVSGRKEERVIRTVKTAAARSGYSQTGEQTHGLSLQGVGRKPRGASRHEMVLPACHDLSRATRTPGGKTPRISSVQMISVVQTVGNDGRKRTKLECLFIFLLRILKMYTADAERPAQLHLCLFSRDEFGFPSSRTTGSDRPSYIFRFYHVHSFSFYSFLNWV